MKENNVGQSVSMNREIKFRAWCKDVKTMTYEVQKPINLGIDNLYFHHFIQDCFILMQYTGLKDKNGVEIYEGDIVKCLSYSQYNLKVEYIDGGFRLVGKHFSYKEKNNISIKDDIYFPIDTRPYICEVIGNIYQNPKLLSEK